MKKCHACAELIQDEAQKCKHCGEIQNTEAVQNARNIQLIWGLVCGGIAVYITYYGYTNNWVFRAFIDGMIEPFIYLFK